METLEAVKHSKATLEAQLNSQRSLIESMRQELGSAKVRCGAGCVHCQDCAAHQVHLGVVGDLAVMLLQADVALRCNADLASFGDWC